MIINKKDVSDVEMIRLIRVFLMDATGPHIATLALSRDIWVAIKTRLSRDTEELLKQAEK